MGAFSFGLLHVSLESILPSIPETEKLMQDTFYKFGTKINSQTHIQKFSNPRRFIMKSILKCNFTVQLMRNTFLNNLYCGYKLRTFQKSKSEPCRIEKGRRPIFLSSSFQVDKSNPGTKPA